ncbi:hypothetical protein FOZ62_005175, partial [Perkinsus olseni]
VPVHFKVACDFDEWREDPLTQVNDRIGHFSGDREAAQNVRNQLTENVKCFERNNGEWLYAKHKMEPGEELFRLDGVCHFCATAASVVEVIAAEMGTTQPDETTVHDGESRAVKPSTSDRRARATKGFPPEHWKILMVNFCMPVKTYSWEGGDDNESGEVRRGSGQERIDCGHLYVVGNHRYFKGINLFKEAKDLEHYAAASAVSLKKAPVRLVVDEKHSGLVRVVAGSAGIYKGDLLWLRCEKTRNIIDLKDPTTTPNEEVEAHNRQEIEEGSPSPNVVKKKKARVSKPKPTAKDKRTGKALSEQLLGGSEDGQSMQKSEHFKIFESKRVLKIWFAGLLRQVSRSW